MRVAPERSSLARLATVLVGFAAGPILGLLLAAFFAPGSDLVRTVGAFAFAAAFMVGVLAWAGLGILAAVLSGLPRLLRGRRPRPAPVGAEERLVPPGSRSFAWFGVLAGVATGVVAGAATALTVVQAVGIWGAAGLAYGGFLWAAAHHGYLPFPEGD